MLTIKGKLHQGKLVVAKFVKKGMQKNEKNKRRNKTKKFWLLKKPLYQKPVIIHVPYIYIL